MEDQLARLVSSADDATRRTQALEQRLAYFENLSYETTRAQRYANAEYLRLAQDRTSSGEKRILVAGWYGAGNLGDELILRAVLSQLPEKAPGRTTVLLWDNPTYERLSLDLRVNTIHYPTTTWQLETLANAFDIVVLGGGAGGRTKSWTLHKWVGTADDFLYMLADPVVEWSRFSGQLLKHLQAASRSKSQGAIYPFLECNRCLL